MSVAITLQKLREFLEQAYEAGYQGCLELKIEYVDDVIQSIINGKIEVPSISPNDGWKIYKVSELMKEPVGTIFEHNRLGKCWIDADMNNQKNKYMTFANGETKYFQADSSPWDEPMRLLQKVDS